METLFFPTLMKDLVIQGYTILHLEITNSSHTLWELNYFNFLLYFMQIIAW